MTDGSAVCKAHDQLYTCLLFWLLSITLHLVLFDLLPTPNAFHASFTAYITCYILKEGDDVEYWITDSDITYCVILKLQLHNF